MFLGEVVAATYRVARPAGELTSQYTPASLTRLDPDLGWTLNPGALVSASRKWNDTTLFQVTYTVSDAGVRTTRGDPKGETWLFVGCSFTFGEGVNDDETLPARVSEQLGWRANVVNVSATGWGAHQVLRALETGRLGGAHAPVKHVIYQALPAHVARSAGRARWDVDGPAYGFSGDSVAFKGQLHGRRFVKTIKFLQQSDLARRLIDRLYYNRAPTDREIDLYVRIVESAAAHAKRDLGAPFTILFWDDDKNADARRINERLAATGLPIIRTTSFMSRHELDSLVIPHDGHPTPEAYRRLAKGLATYFAEAGIPNKSR
jgi:hypothetical protein